MSKTLEQIDDALENTYYLAYFGLEFIENEKKMALLFNKHFERWRRELIRLESKGKWFDKIESYAKTFSPPVFKGEKEEVIEKKNYSGDAKKVKEFTDSIMGEWKTFIEEDLKELNKQQTGLMIANFDVSGQAFVNNFYTNTAKKEFKLKDPKLISALEERTEWLMEKASDLEWERITTKSADWFYFKGMNPHKLRSWVSSAKGYIRTYKGRSLNIARTEVAWSQTQATYAQMRKTEVPFKKFVTEPRNQWPCDLCQQNEDTGVIKVDEDFPNGDVPVHPRCRCCTVPIVPDDWSPVDEWYGEPGVKDIVEVDSSGMIVGEYK